MRTQDLADPRSWRAWDGTGFNARFIDPYRESPEPYNRHVCEPIDREQLGASGAPNRSLTYNTYLGKYVVTGTSSRYDEAQGRAVWGFYFSLSDDLIHWTDLQIIMETHAMYMCGDPDPTAYPVLLDPDAPDRNLTITDRQNYLFFMRHRISMCQPTGHRDLSASRSSSRSERRAQRRLLRQHLPAPRAWARSRRTRWRATTPSTSSPQDRPAATERFPPSSWARPPTERASSRARANLSPRATPTRSSTSMSMPGASRLSFRSARPGATARTMTSGSAAHRPTALMCSSTRESRSCPRTRTTASRWTPSRTVAPTCMSAPAHPPPWSRPTRSGAALITGFAPRIPRRTVHVS